MLDMWLKFLVWVRDIYDTSDKQLLVPMTKTTRQWRGSEFFSVSPPGPVGFKF